MIYFRIDFKNFFFYTYEVEISPIIKAQIVARQDSSHNKIISDTQDGLTPSFSKFLYSTTNNKNNNTIKKIKKRSKNRRNNCKNSFYIKGTSVPFFLTSNTLSSSPTTPRKSNTLPVIGKWALS